MSTRYRENIIDYLCKSYIYIYTGWAKSHFTLLKANKAKPDGAKKIGCI